LISLHRSSLGFLFSLFVSPDAPDKEQNKKPRTKKQKHNATNKCNNPLVVRSFAFLLFLAFHLVVTKVPRKLQRFAIVRQALRLDSGGR